MKAKCFIIITIGIISFVYNFVNGDLIIFVQQINFQAIANSHLGIVGEDGYFGMLFDLILSFSFNLNIRDITSFFKILGG